MLVAALRLFDLAQNSLWIDEYASLATARAPLANVAQAAIGDHALNPPLYFWILHLTINTLGDGEIAIRLPSAVAGVLTTPLVWLLAREVTRSTWVANLSAFLLALNPLHLWYSQEARPYALLLCFTAAALACLAKALRTDTGWWWTAFALTSALSLLTHVFGVVPLSVGAVWVLFSRERRVAFHFLAAAVASLIVVLPVVIMLLSAVADVEGPGAPARSLTGLETLYTLYSFLAGYSYGPPVRELQELGSREAILRHLPAVVSVAALLLALAWPVVRDRPRAAGVLAVAVIVPLAGALGACVIAGTNYSVRYATPGLIGFLPLLALGLSRMQPRLRVVGAGVLLGLFLASDAQWFLAPEYGKEDSRAAVRCLNRVLGADATVAVAPAYMASVLKEYAAREGGSLRIVAVAEPRDLATVEAAALLLTRLQHIPDATLLRRTFSGGTEPAPLAASITGYRVYLASSAPDDRLKCSPGAAQPGATAPR
jgi:4-amino-4-deoxy-L-arabinose transferase-like glycosyltransferase